MENFTEIISEEPLHQVTKCKRGSQI